MNNTLSATKSEYLNRIIDLTASKNPNEPEFLQAVKEVLSSLEPVILKHEEEYKPIALLERVVEPERIISFRVPWIDDKGQAQVNRGFKISPYS